MIQAVKRTNGVFGTTQQISSILTKLTTNDKKRTIIITRSFNTSNSKILLTGGGYVLVDKCNDRSPISITRSFTTSTTLFSGGYEIADKCDLNIVKSPYPPIDEGPYPPLYEFITKNWNHKNQIDGIIESSKVAIIDGSTGMERTFHDYYVTSTGLAGYLQSELGVNETTTIALYSPNHVDYLPICLGIALCGAKMTPINPLNTLHELVTVLDRSETSILIVHQSKLDIAMQAIKDTKFIKNIIVISDDDIDEHIPYGTVSLNSIRNHARAFDKSVDFLHSDNNTSIHPYCIPYSSGTTGLPKGVCLSHSNIISNLLQCCKVENDKFLYNDKLISPLPFFHIYAYTVSLFYPAWKGNTVITLSKRFELEIFCKLVEKYKPSRAHLVPPIILGLEKHPIIDNYDMSSLKMIISAAAPLSSNTELAVKNRIGSTIKQAWGMSELSPIGTFNTDTNLKPGSVGPLVSSTEGKIICVETGNSLGPNEPGELLLRGPQVMLGYLNEINKTLECLSPNSGWLRTGDIAIYDNDGHFYITDRIKELIKVNGFQVAPAELEALLIQHPYINDAAVIAINDPNTGELPRAYIVLKKDDKEIENKNEGEIQKHIYEWIKERVAPYKRLNGGIYIVDMIPKSASGKILRRILKDQAIQEQDQELQEQNQAMQEKQQL